MPLTSANPLDVPATSNQVMYGMMFRPQGSSGLLLLTHQQYRANIDGSGAVAIGPVIQNCYPDVQVAVGADATLATLWAEVQGFANDFANAKSFAGAIGWSLVPVIRGGKITAKMIFWVDGVAKYISTDVFIDAQSDASLANLVVPFQTAIGVYAVVKGW